MKAKVTSLTKKKGMSWGIADLRIVCTKQLAIISLYPSPFHLSSQGEYASMRPHTICWAGAWTFFCWVATRAGRAMVDGRMRVGWQKALASGRTNRVFMVAVRVSALLWRPIATVLELDGGIDVPVGGGTVRGDGG